MRLGIGAATFTSLFRYCLRLAAKEQLLVVGALRPKEVGRNHPLTTLLLGLRRNGQVTDIELGPLSRAETATLAGPITGGALTHDVGRSVAKRIQQCLVDAGHGHRQVDRAHLSTNSLPKDRHRFIPGQDLRAAHM